MPRPKSKIVLPLDFPNGQCQIVRNTYCYVGDKVDIAKTVYTHNGCACNEVLALKFRHQVRTPPFYGDIEELEENLDYIRRKVGGPESQTLKTRLEVVNNYCGRWKKRYYDAMVSLRDTPLTHQDFYNNMFVKADKEDKPIESAPRAIQYRRARCALEMGRMTHSIETEIYQIKDEHGTRIFGKGCNFHELAEDFVLKASLFSDPVYIMLDASKFDAHVTTDCLQMMRRFYKSLFKRREATYVNYLYGKTITNQGFSRHGVRYKTSGTRMSGDMDTGLGNCLIMYTMLVAYMKRSMISKYVMSVNGDDSVIVIERSQLAKATDISCFQDWGFKMKFEVCYELQDVEYCQCKMVETDYGWIMCRSPERILSRDGWSVNRYGGRNLKNYVYSLAMGEMAVNYGLPIGYPLAEKFYALVGEQELAMKSRKATYTVEKQRYWHNVHGATISGATRASYENAFGIPPGRQIEIENSLNVTLGLNITEQQNTNYVDYLLSEPVMG